jgi:hypothetical protein
MYVCTPGVLRLSRGPVAVTGSPPHLYMYSLYVPVCNTSRIPNPISYAFQAVRVRVLLDEARMLS